MHITIRYVWLYVKIRRMPLFATYEEIQFLMMMNCFNEGQIYLLYVKTRNQEEFLIT